MCILPPLSLCMSAICYRFNEDELIILLLIIKFRHMGLQIQTLIMEFGFKILQIKIISLIIISLQQEQLETLVYI